MKIYNLVCPSRKSLLFNRSVVSDSVMLWTAALQSSLSFSISRSLLKLMSVESVMPSNHLIFCHRLLLLPSIFPSMSKVKVIQSWPILQPHGLYSPRNSPGQNTGVCSLSHLQGIFPTQGSNPGYPHCRWILYYLSHKGSPFQHQSLF